MGRELGRISGPLLAENLLRNGNNLVFDSNLFLLNVGSKRLGINTLAPTRDLTVANTADTTDLIVDTQSEIANFVITSDQIQNPITTITISPYQDNPVITTPGLATSLLTFSGDTLVNNTIGSNIEFTPSGSGVTNIRNNTLVNGSLHAPGNITWDGDIQLGNNSSDTITFSADVDSSIVPNINNTYDLGSTSLKWNTLYAKNLDSISLTSDLVTTGIATVGNVKFETNTISNTSSSTDITVAASGTGLTYFNGINYVNGNQIPVPGTFTLNSTANGYTKFAGNLGITIPISNSSSTTGVEAGMLRFDPDLGYVRIFNGTFWQPVGGISETLNVDQVSETMFIWDLILG
jgi:hypothetical protein